MKSLNEFFERSKLPLRIKELFLFRPAFDEIPFEHIEIVSEAERARHCDPFYILFRMEKDGLDYEYEQRYRNRDGEFELTLCRLQDFDVLPNHDQNLEDIEKAVTPFAKIIGLSIIEMIKGFSGGKK